MKAADLIIYVLEFAQIAVGIFIVFVIVLGKYEDYRWKQLRISGRSLPKWMVR